MTTDGASPVSWFVIERGWKVIGSDGSELGTVEETVGDSNRDIFDGLTVRMHRLEKPRYLPAEDVESIVEGTITVRLSSDQAQQLKPYDEPPPQEEVLPEGGSWWTRLLDSLRRPRS